MLQLAWLLINDARHRAHTAREEGASALEWAIIAAIVVVAATAVGAVVYKVVTNKASQIDNCGSLPAGSKC
ncbi:hypothetical protein [Luteipulveratus mongoliensis]|uniref:Uncharacterized protein n=1 Tax=Luteipulveratus mongoliensis TaxID=571913 RepID=A0A0K1JMY3_9MICO|nr:hypothetical protein [Luteipulveratus mongoliensis]AKU18066.1 hypothetical protein VV02_23035 [Luteipulveratus mongoliensis]